MSGADILILFVVLASALVGLMRGFVREAVSLVFWIVGLYAAWSYGSRVEPYLGGYLASPALRPWIARLIVLVAVVFAGHLVGHFLGLIMRSVGLGMPDRLLGLMFGALRGSVLVALVVIGGQLVHLNTESWWHRSTLIPYGEKLGDWFKTMAGENGNAWPKHRRRTAVDVN